MFGRGLVVSAAVLGAAAAPAAQVFYQPLATLGVENDSNLDMDPGGHQQVQGYLADVATVVGIDTPEWSTLLRPRVVYRRYPESSVDDRIETYLDLNSTYKTQRGIASLSGSYQHLDEINAQFAPPTFNDIVPNQPTPDNSRAATGATQDTAFLSPKYVYSFTPTIGGGVSANYEDVRYSPSDGTSHQNFDYYQGRAFLNYALNPTSTLTFGGLGSRFETKSVDSRATGSGALVDLTTMWTPLLTTVEELNYQRTKLDSTFPTPIDEAVNKVGGFVDVSYKTELDRFRLVARRSIAPSGGAAVYTTDRLQFQYDRTLTARFAMTGAVAYVHTRGLTEGLSGQDSRYAQALVEVHYDLTRYFFLQGGYQYAYQRYQVDPMSAGNNRVYLEIGYKGIAPQR
jgi:hypothetical protein